MNHTVVLYSSDTMNFVEYLGVYEKSKPLPLTTNVRKAKWFDNCEEAMRAAQEIAYHGLGKFHPVIL